MKNSDCNDCLRNICEILNTQRHEKVSTNPKVLCTEDLNVPKEDEVVRRHPEITCDKILQFLTERIIFVFGKRSIDPSQWCRSARRRTSSRESHVYSETAKDKEILLELLSSEKKELIDSKTEQTYFRSLIFPQEYGFELHEDGKGCNVIKKKHELADFYYKDFGWHYRS